MFELPLSIIFGARGDYKRLHGRGWYHDDSENDYTWTSHVAELRLSMPLVRRSIGVAVDLIPHGAQQDVFLYVNGLFVTFWSVDCPISVNASFSPTFLRASENSLTIVCPRATSPASSTDQRVLGVAVRSIKLTELS